MDFAAEAPDLPESLTDEFGREFTPGRAWRRSVAEGRPLLGLANYLAYEMASELEHLRYVRFVGVLGMALLAWSLYRALAGAGHRRLRASAWRPSPAPPGDELRRLSGEVLAAPWWTVI